VKKSEFDQWIGRFRNSRNRDIDVLADEVMNEIGCVGRRSKKVSL
jgi:hypothetical protein